jgi:hypothetical protein
LGRGAQSSCTYAFARGLSYPWLRGIFLENGLKGRGKEIRVRI